MDRQNDRQTELETLLSHTLLWAVKIESSARARTEFQIDFKLNLFLLLTILINREPIGFLSNKIPILNTHFSFLLLFHEIKTIFGGIISTFEGNSPDYECAFK